MLGTSCLLAIVIFRASPDDAGFASVEDQRPAAHAMAGRADVVPTGYIAPVSQGDGVAGNSRSLLQTMLDENQPKPPRRENPFKEEPTAPHETPAEPPRRLPPTAEQPPESPDFLPWTQTSPPAAKRRAGLAEAVGDCRVPTACGAADADECDTCEPTPFNHGRIALRDWFCDIRCEGWIDQGVTINTFSPRDRSNFPVVFNNRSNEYQLNQAYVRLQRPVNADGGRWGVGGTVDLLYGTDSLFTTSRGLEVNRDFGPKWNAQQYGLAMPQLYMEVAVPWGDDGATVKLGHFYTIVGYETTPAPENFFYSHSLCLFYGQPVTETGLLGEKKVGNFKFQAGVTRGWDNWEDNNNDLSFLGGITWTDSDNCSSLAVAVQSGPEQNEPPESTNFRNLVTLVYQQKLGERWQYVLEYDFGQEERNDLLRLPPAKWVDLMSCLFYTINDHWKAGVRAEWFADGAGVRVPGAVPNTDLYEISVGLNWTPRSRVIVRPELRYDWTGSPNFTPYVDSSKSYQLLVDCDVIVKF
jgi:hypothetical protein